MSVQVLDLVKQYGTQKAVNHISFQAKPGEILGFLGPNGAGKSTTMKIATGYVAATSGDVKICGKSVENNSLEVRKMVGYLPEHNPLYLDMYVREYLLHVASLYGLKGRLAKDKVQYMLETVGLQREQHKKIGALSKGYRQRVGLAQALVHEPQVLILDEPTSGLDPNQIQEIRHVIRQVSQDKTVLFSTHIMQEVQALCDRVVIINSGELVADSPVGQLKSGQQKAKILLEFLNPVPSADKIEALEGVEGVTGSGKKWEITAELQPDVRPLIFQLAVEQNWVIVEMTRESVSLESIFHELTAR